ncbi:NUDIX domain-containing protein [Clostridium sp. YIM B02551]|uniref:NUDIX domain-containing protein n=1 Tax=Clostridium sp. YIM B02551 TaxID=2910679 RepID=UPI0027D21683|nr:NUDIX domain-containing protein [Clostridium sp. YIM B02551]
MIKVNFYDLNSIEDSKLKFAVIMARFKGNWIYVKHKDRCTLEIPGGHREENEDIINTASRELYEETGAKKFEITPVCIYSVERDEASDYTESFGELFYAKIDEIDKLPEFEIEEIKLFSDIPEELTYPLIQPFLHKMVIEFIEKNDMKSHDNMLNYYKEELKWNPPFADVLSKYSPKGLEGYLIMRESVEEGHLPKKTRELIFTILDSLDDEVTGAKAHAVAAIEAGLTMEELVDAFMIVTMVKGINVLCKAGIEAINAAESRYKEMSTVKESSK